MAKRLLINRVGASACPMPIPWPLGQLQITETEALPATCASIPGTARAGLKKAAILTAKRLVITQAGPSVCQMPIPWPLGRVLMTEMEAMPDTCASITGTARAGLKKAAILTERRLVIYQAGPSVCPMPIPWLLGHPEMTETEQMPDTCASIPGTARAGLKKAAILTAKRLGTVRFPFHSTNTPSVCQMPIP